MRPIGSDALGAHAATRGLLLLTAGVTGMGCTDSRYTAATRLSVTGGLPR
jgi:hypothetical protein